MSPFALGTRVVVRIGGEGAMAVGTIDRQQPDVWTIQLAEPVAADEFLPGTSLVISSSTEGGLWVARSQLLRRSDATFVVSRPRVTDRRDRRRDHRLTARGTVAWSARVGTGSAPAVDVSRSGLKLEVGNLLRVGDVAALDITGAGRVSALVVAVTDGSRAVAAPDGDSGAVTSSERVGATRRTRYAHLAFLRVDEQTRDAIVSALAVSGATGESAAAEAVTVDLRASAFSLGVSA